MSESETYKELGALNRCKERWEECIPFVASLLTSDSVKIQAKALWMLGEMGLAFPEAIKSSVPAIAAFLIMLGYIPVIAKRIQNEEIVLEEGLEGYAEYMKKVKYRILPYVW